MCLRFSIIWLNRVSAKQERTRTAEPGSREKYARRHRVSLESAVAGLDSTNLSRQSPAESREFIELGLDISKTSLLAQTRWR